MDTPKPIAEIGPRVPSRSVTSPQVVTEVVLPEIRRFVEMAQRDENEALGLRLLEPPAQFRVAFLEEFDQSLSKGVGESDVEAPGGTADHETEVVMAGLLHARHLSLEGLLPFLPKPVGGKVAEGFGDEVLVLWARGEVEIDLKTAVQGWRSSTRT
ncbi:MAG: hypothetical protein M1144_05625 [Candidatus Thermoplasmatota archaeon]|nr:hypothetical protein [Candidatus Thermoplasmatota archaeon]